MPNKKFTDKQIAEHLIQRISMGWTIAEAAKILGLSYAAYTRRYYMVLNDANEMYGSLSSWSKISIVEAKKDPFRVIDMLKRYAESLDDAPEQPAAIVWDDMKATPSRSWGASAFFVLTGFLAGVAFASAASLI